MENPYQPEPDAPPELRLSAVAFLDLLGYSERIRGAESIDEANDELKAIRMALDKAAAHWVKTEEGRPILPHQVRFFTDCLVIGDPIETPSTILVSRRNRNWARYSSFSDSSNCK